MSNEIFRSSRIKLFAPRAEDAKEVCVWHEDAYYLRNVDTEPAYPISEEKAEKEIKGGSGDFYFHLRTLDDDRLIG